MKRREFLNTSIGAEALAGVPPTLSQQATSTTSAAAPSGFGKVGNKLVHKLGEETLVIEPWERVASGEEPGDL
jgi:hypothetical protein